MNLRNILQATRDARGAVVLDAAGRVAQSVGQVNGDVISALMRECRSEIIELGKAARLGAPTGWTLGYKDRVVVVSFQPNGAVGLVADATDRPEIVLRALRERAQGA